LQDGHTPRPLQEKATTKPVRHVMQTARANPKQSSPDHREAPRGRGRVGPRQDRAGGGAEAWRDGADLLPMEAGVRWATDGPGKAAEGSREGERPAEATPGGRRTRQGDPAALAIRNVGKRRDATTGGHAAGGHAAEGFCDSREKLRSHDTSRIAWAKLMARVGEEFPLQCPGCGGGIRLKGDGRQEPAHCEPEVRKRKKGRKAAARGTRAAHRLGKGCGSAIDRTNLPSSARH